MALDQNTNGIHLFIEVSVLEWQRLVLSSLSKSFSHNPVKIFCAVDVQLLVKLSFARVYELNWNWQIDFFYLYLTQLQISNFQFLQSLRCISKNENNHCSRRCCCCCVLPPHIKHICTQDTRSYFLKENLEIFLAFLNYLSNMLFLTIFDEVMFQLIKMNWDRLHFDQIHTWHRCLKLSSACTSMWGISVKTVPPGKAMSEIIFTTPLIIYNSSELINSALFSRANQGFMFSSATVFIHL